MTGMYRSGTQSASADPGDYANQQEPVSGSLPYQWQCNLPISQAIDQSFRSLDLEKHDDLKFWKNSGISWQVTSMFGYTLRQGCLVVGLMTVAISVLMFIYGLGCILQDPPENGYNSDPEVAMHLIFGLFAASVSLYQILISLLLALQAKLAATFDHAAVPSQIRRVFRLIPDQDENIFYCTLWHVSHLSILTFYFILFCAKAAICFERKDFLVGSMTGVIGMIYISIFIYFEIVVSSFSHSLEQDIYY